MHVIDSDLGQSGASAADREGFQRLLLYENRELRQRMALAAREKIIKSFSVANMAAQYHELYLNVKSSGLED